jgi:hypothetical protein
MCKSGPPIRRNGGAARLVREYCAAPHVWSMWGMPRRARAIKVCGLGFHNFLFRCKVHGAVLLVFAFGVAAFGGWSMQLHASDYFAPALAPVLARPMRVMPLSFNAHAIAANVVHLLRAAD